MGRFAWRASGTLAAALLAGCAGVPHSLPADRHASLQYTDLTGRFAALYDEAAASSEADRVQHIRQGMDAHIRGFYGPEPTEEGAERYNRRMAAFLTRYPQQREDIALVAARFSKMFQPAVADFEGRLRKLPRDVPVALVISMGEFDGGTRELNGQPFLLFGADMIAELHRGEARAFVQHELVHIYHQQYFTQCAEVWCSLWSEGLAVHVAHELNPDASDGELLLDQPEPIRPSLEQHRTEAICSVLARFDSLDPKDHAALFSYERLNARLPARYGYLVGAWVAEDIGRSHSLRDMARMPAGDVRAAIEESLTSMTDCT